MNLESGSTIFLFRILLPFTFLTASILRINVISLVYCILLLPVPFLHTPSPDAIISWWTRKYLLSTVIAGLAASLAQVIFHVSLLANPPYGYDFSDCEFYEVLARQLGFQRLDLATGWQLVRLVSPEILVCSVSIYLYTKFNKSFNLDGSGSSPPKASASQILLQSLASNRIANVAEEVVQRSIHEENNEEASDRQKWKEWLVKKRLQESIHKLNQILFTTLLAAAGVLHPCLLTVLYFFAFLFLCTYWSLDLQLPLSYWHKFRKTFAVYSGAHSMLIYVYQFEIAQTILPSENLFARLLGLLSIIKPQCEDVRSYIWHERCTWASFLFPISLVSLYGLSAYQIRNSSNTDYDTKVISEKEERVTKETVSNGRSYRSRRRDRSPWATEKLLDEPTVTTIENVEDGITCTVLMSNADQRSRHNSRITRDSETRRSTSRIRSRRHSMYFGSVQLDTGGAGVVFAFMKQQSYVMSLFMMMAWSITYHSWTTFILLLMACTVWMVPDSRKFCLKLSPFVLVYAEILLITQFLYGLDLTEEELPDEHPPILRQIGFEKPRGMPACVPLMVKTLYTLMFWVTLRQHIQERKIRHRESLSDVVKHSVHVASSITRPGIIKPASPLKRISSMKSRSSRPSSRWGSQTSVLLPAKARVQQFGTFVRGLIAKYWILICCGLLLFISLRTPVVAYRIMYMAYFLVFVNCFQISFKYWRRLLYPFWMLMIVYCMAVLTLIYTYQFHGFPEMWKNGTGLDYDVLESFGLEQYSSGELFLKLLTPISFLIFTIVQVNFFHRDLMRRTRRLENLLYPSSPSRASMLLKSIKRHTSNRWIAASKRIPIRHRSGRARSLGARSRSSSGDGTTGTVTPVKRPKRSHTFSFVNEAYEDRMSKEILSAPLKSVGIKQPESMAEVVKLLRVETAPKDEKLNNQGDMMTKIMTNWKILCSYQDQLANLIWRFLEIHVSKFVAFTMLGIAICEVSAVNIPYVIFALIILPLERLTMLVGHVCGVWTSCIIVIKMLYQMKFIKLEDVYVHCSDRPNINGTRFNAIYPFHTNATVDSAAWAGFHKTDEIFFYLKGYICLVILLAFQSVVHWRQKLHRKKLNFKEPPRGVLLPEITRRKADLGLPSCFLYFVNHFFYKFGLELCILSTVGTVGIRSDFVSILYSLCLIFFMTQTRKTSAKYWPYYVCFLGVLLPTQYFLCVGIPPSLCSSYPWSNWNTDLVEWLFLPDFSVPPYSIKLGADFLQFICASCQLYVFRIEQGPDAFDYAGGENTSILDTLYIQPVTTEPESPAKSHASSTSVPESATVDATKEYLENGKRSPEQLSRTPELVSVPDFIGVSKSYLDLIKVVLFVYLYWVTLAIVFVAGVSRVTLFAMGYVVACFLFLWVGNDVFLKPLQIWCRLWNVLIAYNIIVIFLKTSLQVVGCVYMDQMFRNYCWVLQLFGIACLKTGKEPEEVLDPSILSECNVPTAEAGILFDGVCLFFLLLQRRIVCSNYFKHVIAEYKAQQTFASRGAELISRIVQKDTAEQRVKEDEIVHKIKKKMDKIKQTQAKSNVKVGKGAKSTRHDGGISGGVRKKVPKKLLKIKTGKYSTPKKTSETQTLMEHEPLLSLYDISLQVQQMRGKSHGLHSDRSSFSFPVDPYDEEPTGPADNISLQESMAGLMHERRLPTYVASPQTVNELGISRSMLLAQRDFSAPTLRLDDIAPVTVPSPQSMPCHIVGPDIIPSPDSTDYVPFMTSPSPRVHPDTSSGAKRRQIRIVRRKPCQAASAPLGWKKVVERGSSPTGEAIKKVTSKREKRQRESFASRASKESFKKPQILRRRKDSNSSSVLYSAGSDDWGIANIGDSEGEGSGGELMPEMEGADLMQAEDRRKGLGPLQLLNVAFKRGTIKHAVKESKEMVHQHEQLQKQMEEQLGHANVKAIRRHLKRQKSRKVLADFEEDTFDDDPIIGPRGVPESSREHKDDRMRHPLLRQSTIQSKNDSDVLPPPYSEAVLGEGGHLLIGQDSVMFENPEDSDAVDDEVEEFMQANLETPQDRTDNTPPEKISIIKKIVLFVHDYIRNAILFVQLFGSGVIESMITWLLKASRDYRYVSSVLSAEKRIYKRNHLVRFADDVDRDSRSEMQEELLQSPSLFQGDESVLQLHRYMQKQENGDQSTGLPETETEEGGTDEEAMKAFEKQKNVFVRMFVASSYVLISRSELFCFLMIVLNHMTSASFISMPLPVMAFLWGTLSVPRPSKLFWITLITYTEAMVVVKYLFQFGFFPWNKGAAPPDPFWPPRILGIEKQDKYAAWDLALLMTLFFHRSIMKALGSWKEQKRMEDNTSSIGCDDLSLSEPPSLMQSPTGSNKKGDDTLDMLRTDSNNDPTIMQFYRNDQMNEWSERKAKIRKGLLQYVKQIVRFFRVLLIPEDRCSVDVYAPMFLCDFICFLVVIFGFAAFGTDTGEGGVSAVLEENKIPGPFLAMLVVQFALIIIDRALFLRKFLFGKVVYQVGLVIFVHIWMFFLLPGVTERRFVNNRPAKIWYFTKCVYFCLSAWQIRCGYPTRILGNVLTKKHTPINWFLFKAFMSIPFLFELRALMDWIWTDTSMSIGDWLKMEDIYSNVYQIKCERKLEEDYPSPRGVKKRPLLKYGLGGFLLFGIILIIWFPLVLFSLANTVGMRMIPIDCTIRLSIGGYQPLFQASAQQHFLRPLYFQEYDALQYRYRYSKLALAYMSDYSHGDLVRAELNGNSTSVWGISPPSKATLIRDLNGTGIIVLKFEWSFTRPPEGKLDPIVVGSSREVELSPGHYVRNQLIQILMGINKKEVLIENVFPAHVKVPGSGKSNHIYALLGDQWPGDLTEGYVDVLLQLHQGDYKSMSASAEWWQLKMLDPEWSPRSKLFKKKRETYESLVIVGFVDKVFPATFNVIAGGGILGLYVSLVLVVGRFIRMLVTGAMYRIMYEELPDVNRILQLCMDIFLVREAGELALEEDLFAKLIFLYRSPATLIKWTKSKNK